MKKVCITNSFGRKIMVGEYDYSEKVFYYRKKRSLHFFRMTKSWAIDKRLLETLASMKATILLIETEKKEKYTIKAEEWLNKGCEDTFFEHKPQIFLEERYFDKA